MEPSGPSPGEGAKKKGEKDGTQAATDKFTIIGRRVSRQWVGYGGKNGPG